MYGSRRPSLPPGPPAAVARATSNDRELIKQWIVYLIGPQPDGPLSGYTVPDPSASVFGALTGSASPSRSNRAGSVGGGAQPVLVSKNISAEAVRPLRLVSQDMAELVRDLAAKEAQEKGLTRRVRQGEVIYEDSAASAAKAGGGQVAREPTVDVEDLDAFLAAEEAPPAASEGAPTSASTGAKGPVNFDAAAIEAICSALAPPSALEAPSSPSSSPSPTGKDKNAREVGRAEADAYQHAQLSQRSARTSVSAAVTKFVATHNARLEQLFFEGGVIGPDATEVTAMLLKATTADAVAGLVAAYAAESANAAAADAEAFATAKKGLEHEMDEVYAAIRECEALSLKGALAEEMGRIEVRLRAAAAHGVAAVRRSQRRLDELRPVLDGPLPSDEMEGGSPPLPQAIGGAYAGSAAVSGGESPTALAAAREPKEVLASVGNAVQTQVAPFANRTRDVFAQRAAAFVERHDDVAPGESLVAYQQARRQQLLQAAEDLAALHGVTERQLGSIRSVFEARDRPAAQAEHDKWAAYTRSLEGVRDQLAASLRARVRYDEETASLRSHERERLPPPPPRYAANLPPAPSDPRPEAARGGLRHLPLTWAERYDRMPPAALLSSQPKELWTPEQRAEAERQRRLEGGPLDDKDGSGGADGEEETFANIAADLVPESERLRHALRVAANKKKAREQCHAAVVRTLGAVMAEEAAREAAAATPLSPTSAAAAQAAGAGSPPRPSGGRGGPTNGALRGASEVFLTACIHVREVTSHIPYAATPWRRCCREHSSPGLFVTPLRFAKN